MTTLEILLSAAFAAVAMIAASLAKRLVRAKVDVYRMEMECKRAKVQVELATQMMDTIAEQTEKLCKGRPATDWPEVIEENK